jgi:hypothetical protein
MVDKYSIPDSIFGYVPEEFYALMGRVVMLGAFLESRLENLLVSMSRSPQDEHAGKHAGLLLKHCRLALASQPSEVKLLATEVLDRAEKALRKRNELVHSVWPSPTLDRASGWSSVPGALRQHPGHPTRWAETSESDLHALIGQMVALAGDLNLLRQANDRRLTDRP